MAYYVKVGEVLDGMAYSVGEKLPYSEGDPIAAEMVASGNIEWRDDKPDPDASEKVAPEVSAAASELARRKEENAEASQAGRVLESARKPRRQAKRGGSR